MLQVIMARLILLLTAVAVYVSSATAQPVAVGTVNSDANAMFLLREKRTAVETYPRNTMMFTGYYRPVRRSSHGDQASGVFAQGNAVSGETYLGDMQPEYLQPESEQNGEGLPVSSAEAAAAPSIEEELEEVQQQEEEHQKEEEETQHPHHDHHHDSQEPQEPHEPHHEHRQSGEADHIVPDLHHHVHTEETPILYTTEVVVTEEPTVHAETTVAPPRKKTVFKKNRKTPASVEHKDEDDLDEEYDDEPALPFVPFKGYNRRRSDYPNLNNFFPMVFSFPRVTARSGSSSSPPGAITAIANSYSTAKGGVASSVATAYGASPNVKRQRHTPVGEE